MQLNNRGHPVPVVSLHYIRNDIMPGGHGVGGSNPTSPIKKSHSGFSGVTLFCGLTEGFDVRPARLRKAEAGYPVSAFFCV